MGETIKARGIVLNKTDYRDNDRVLTVFTVEKGKITVSAKGVKKQTSKLRSASELFTFGDFLLAESHGRYTVTGFDCIEPFHELREQFEVLSAGALMLKITDKALAEGEANITLFTLLLKSLDKLRKSDVPLGFTLSVFLFSLCKGLGYAPEVEGCVECGSGSDLLFLSPASGGIICKGCAIKKSIQPGSPFDGAGNIPYNSGEHFAVSGGCVLYIRKILRGDFDAPFLYKPTERQVRELYSAACRYTAYFFDEKIKIIDYINKYKLI